MSKIWNPENTTVQRRFWFNQLYRILSYNNDNKKVDCNSADSSYDLSEICEGNFNIRFSNNIYLYWIDNNENKIEEVLFKDDSMQILERHVGSTIIKNILLDGYKVENENEKVENIQMEYVNNKEGIVACNGNEEIELIPNVAENSAKMEKNHDIVAVDMLPINTIAKVNELENEQNFIISNEIVSLFQEYKNHMKENEEKEIKDKFNILELILQARKIKIHPRDYIIGPDIIRYCFDLDYTNDVKDITKNQDNIQLKLKLNEPPYIFIEDGLIKMDTARQNRQTVGIKTMYESINNEFEKLKDYKKHLYILIGADVLGKPYILDLSDSNSPHLLIAGQTGSGKSVFAIKYFDFNNEYIYSRGH